MYSLPSPLRGLLHDSPRQLLRLDQLLICQPIIHDLNELSEYVSAVLPVAARPYNAGTRADKGLIFFQPLDDERIF